MFGSLLAPLLATLRPHFNLSKTRLETLAVLLLGLANSRTVNLSHLASQFPGPALHASNYRRLQRFFQHVRLNGDSAAGLIIRLLRLNRPTFLALDRTNWKLGASEVNMLVLAVVTGRFRVPLMWTLIDHSGNSNTTQRIALIRRYLRLFGASSIKALLADREFIGVEWITFLVENKVPFAIRLKEDILLRLEDGSLQKFRTLLRKHKRGSWQGWLKGMEPTSKNQLHVSAKRIRKGELLIVATNLENARHGFNLYRRRWAVECLFADARTRGLNIEDTHITHPDKLATLLVVVALAVTWAYRCATKTMGRKTIRRKTHARREKSWFRTGLDALRNWILYQPQKALQAWTQTGSNRPINTLQS